MADEFADIESLGISPRRENRAAAMQYIYMCDLNEQMHTPEYLDSFLAAKARDREFYAFAEELIAGVFKHIDEIDDKISAVAENWSLDRICKVDLALLRVAVFEMFHRDDIPSVVSINEAIDLSKIFSSPDSKRFINGVLDRLKEGAPKKSADRDRPAKK